jgi:hypothetical protein
MVVGAIGGAYVQLVVDADDPHRHVRPERAVRAFRGELQLLRLADTSKLFLGPRDHRRTSHHEFGIGNSAITLTGANFLSDTQAAKLEGARGDVVVRATQHVRVTNHATTQRNASRGSPRPPRGVLVAGAASR